MNTSIVIPAQSQQWKDSIFHLPKKPSHLALPVPLLRFWQVPGIGAALISLAC